MGGVPCLAFMGITISSKNYEIDMGYFGFAKLRTTIAKLTKPDIYEHYKMLKDIWKYSQKDLDAYNWKIDQLDQKYKGKYSKVLDFLYASDCEGSATYGTCKDLLKVIGDYDDNYRYGYAGREDCAMFSDFKKILEDCAETKTKMVWC